MDLRSTVAPFTDRFRMAIRTSTSGRKQRGRPRAARRAVVAAIDRVADAFLAIDTDSGEIVDANPAAGALLAVDRDALLGVDSLDFVVSTGRDGWWSELDAISEGGETRSFDTRLVDARGQAVDARASATGFRSRGRILALLMVRPLQLSGQASDAPQAKPVAAPEARPLTAQPPIVGPNQ
jgi:PAS domain-containing protein